MELKTLKESLTNNHCDETASMIKKAASTKQEIQGRVNTLRDQKQTRMKEEEDKTLQLGRDLTVLECRSGELTNTLETLDKNHGELLYNLELNEL